VFDQFVTFLYTRDLEQSTAFYGELLGLPLVLDQGGCRIFRVARDAFLGVCRCSEERPCSPGGVIVTLVSDDVDGWYERLEAKGVAFETPPRANPKYRTATRSKSSASKIPPGRLPARLRRGPDLQIGWFAA
jgi:catechol 2,3-dioxygenase-like lactoylglutathione lyase family enzyme